MIIVRTPYRLSLLGGASDYPEHYSKHGGACLVSTIAKYSYVSLRRLPPYFEHRTRVVWSKVELVRNNSEIKHPGINGVLRYLALDDGFEIHYDSDIPARAGMGSSSAFIVGLLNAVWAMSGEGRADPLALAKTAIRVEREFVGDTVGAQDQIATAYGGVNFVEIATDGSFDVTPLTRFRLEELENHLLLLFTGLTRHASEIVRQQMAEFKQHDSTLKEFAKQAAEGARVLCSAQPIGHFFWLMQQAWVLKRRLARSVTSPAIDEMDKRITDAGALACKLVGAGGGGFFLVAVEPERRETFLEHFPGAIWFPVKFAHQGSEVIFHNDG